MRRILYMLVIGYLVAAASPAQQRYKIVNALSGKVMDVANGSTANGATIWQYTWLKGLNQQWTIVPLGNGYSRIVNVNSGKVVDVTGVSTADGALIQQWDWTGGANQQWQIIPQQSSYNEIINLNSQKVLDVANYSLADGASIQQWDWLSGLNQQWQIIPVQDTYQSTGQTNIYYSSGVAQVVATTDSDYSTQYYYHGSQVRTAVTRNGVSVISGQWGFAPGQTGFGSVHLALSAGPGDYIQALSLYNMVLKYTEQQINPGGCANYCLDWYDAFYFSFMEGGSGEGIDIPIFTTTVYAAPIVIAAAVVAKTVHLGQNGSSYHVPGGGNVFSLKLRAFIPPGLC